MRKELLKKCPICASKNISFIYNLFDRLYGVDGDFNIYKCKNCKITFLNPQLNKEEVEKYYPKDYVSFKSSKDSRSFLIKSLYDTYFLKKGNKLLKIFFFPVKHLLRSLPKKENAKFLDVGCGKGIFLNYVKNNKMMPYGIDPFIEKDIPPLNIKKISLLDAKFPNNYFDFITLNNVLEHIPNPLGIIIECKRILKKGGRIFINIPNNSSLAYLLFKKNWVSLDVPRHFFTFSKKSMKLISKKLGLDIIKTKYKSEPFTLISSLIYKYSNEKKLSENKIMSNFWINVLTLPISVLLNILKIGDQVEYCLRK